MSSTKRMAAASRRDGYRLAIRRAEWALRQMGPAVPLDLSLSPDGAVCIYLHESDVYLLYRTLTEEEDWQTKSLACSPFSFDPSFACNGVSFESAEHAF